MKLFYTVIFLLSLASAAFAREESVLVRVTSYWANEGTSGEYARYGRTFARRPLRCRSETNSVREQSCFSRWRLHRRRHRTGSG